MTELKSSTWLIGQLSEPLMPKPLWTQRISFNWCALGETSMMFLVHPTLTNEEINKTCDVIREVLTIAQK